MRCSRGRPTAASRSSYTHDAQSHGLRRPGARAVAIAAMSVVMVTPPEAGALGRKPPEHTPTPPRADAGRASLDALAVASHLAFGMANGATFAAQAEDYRQPTSLFPSYGCVAPPSAGIAAAAVRSTGETDSGQWAFDDDPCFVGHVRWVVSLRVDTQLTQLSAQCSSSDSPDVKMIGGSAPWRTRRSARTPDESSTSRGRSPWRSRDLPGSGR